MRPWSTCGVLFFLFAIALVIIPTDALALDDQNEGGGMAVRQSLLPATNLEGDCGGDGNQCEDIPPEPVDTTDGGTVTRCTGIGGCNNCVRDPFTLNYKSCKFTDDQDGVCKCWPAGYGKCTTSGTCIYVRFGT